MQQSKGKKWSISHYYFPQTRKQVENQNTSIETFENLITNFH